MRFTPSVVKMPRTIEQMVERRTILKKMCLRSGLLVRVLGRGLLRRCAARGTNPFGGDRKHDAQASPATLA